MEKNRIDKISYFLKILLKNKHYLYFFEIVIFIK